jgi:hypothetical protein
MAMNENENASINPESFGGNVSRDTEMNITDLLRTSKPSAETDEAVGPGPDFNANEEASAQPEEHKSALQRFKEEREKNGGGGLIVNTAEMEEKNKEKELKNRAMDDASTEADEYMGEMDEMIKAAQNVKLAHPPQNASEMVAVMENLSDVSKGQAMRVDAGQKPMLVAKDENEKLETAEDAPVESEEDTTEPTPTISPEKQQLVNILIDKTGMGYDWKFSEEEQAKMVSAAEVRVTEVEEVDLATITVKKAEKSFIDTVTEFQTGMSKVPVIFPASRFRAYMTGLSYGEMGDIANNNENITFDQVKKKLTVIYNKMVNPSCGKFENFEDFLRKFAYVDIDLAVYALVVATFPEVDDITLTCNNPTCKKSFNHRYSPRSLIRFESSSEHMLKKMNDVINCSEADFAKLMEESPTQNHKRYRLNQSGYIIEVGIASAYDWLYTMMDNLIGSKFEDEHPDDVNGILQINAALLGLIRTVFVPDPNEPGSYIQYDEFEDMIQALYSIKPEEISILSSILEKYNSGYRVVFELQNIKCPHCGHLTKRIPVDINDLIFFKYQRLMSTSIDVNNVFVV